MCCCCAVFTSFMYDIVYEGQEIQLFNDIDLTENLHEANTL